MRTPLGFLLAAPLLVTSLSLASAPAAQAQWRHGGYSGRHYGHVHGRFDRGGYRGYHHYGYGGALIGGLAAGALIGALGAGIAAPPPAVVYARPPVVYAQPPVVYAAPPPPVIYSAPPPPPYYYPGY